MLSTALTLISMYAGFASIQGTTPAPAQKPTFAMSIRLKESTARVGAEVVLDIDLTNTSATEVRFLLPASGPVLYRFKVLGPDGKLAPLTPIGQAIVNGGGFFQGKKGETRLIGGGSVFSVVVAPGKVLHDSVVLSDYVDLRQPQGYTISVQRTDPYTKLIVDSNTTTLTVTKQE